MTSDKYLRRAFESTTGIPPSSNASMRTSSGFVISKSQLEQKKKRAKENGWNDGPDAIYEIDDNDEFGAGLSAHGDIQIILRPEVSGRTSYMRGDPITSGGRPVRMNSSNREDILDAIINSDGANKKSQMADAVLNLLKAKVGKSQPINESRKVSKGEESSAKSNSVMHAEILGGYSLSDIEGIHYPFSRVQKVAQNTKISDVTEGIVKFEEIIASKVSEPDAKIIISRINSGDIDTPAVRALKEYRTAMKIRQKYKAKGIGYVLFAHPKGTNIENPKSYDPNAKSGETVEQVLRRQIQMEVKSSIKKMADEMIKARNGK